MPVSLGSSWAGFNFLAIFKNRLRRRFLDCLSVTCRNERKEEKEKKEKTETGLLQEN